MLTGVFPPNDQPMADPLWLLPTAYRIAFGIAGCYLAAWLAPDRPMRHAMVLGAIGVAVGIVGFAVTWNEGLEIGPMLCRVSPAKRLQRSFRNQAATGKISAWSRVM